MLHRGQNVKNRKVFEGSHAVRFQLVIMGKSVITFCYELSQNKNRAY